jgi:uncharacterized membrane protein YbhN (UPF0104 family)
MSLPDSERLDRLRQLTERYSRFSQTQGGVAFILAAGLILLVRFLPAPNVFSGVVYTILGAVIWLFARPAITNRLYQKFGVVQERTRKRSTTDFLVGLMMGFAVVSALVFFVTNSSSLFNAEVAKPSMRQLPLLAAVILGIVVIGRNRLTDGIIILFLGAATTSANNLPLFTPLQEIVSHFISVLVPVAFCGIGILQHQDFRRLERDFARLSTAS